MRRLLLVFLLLSGQASALTLVTEDYPPLNFTTDGGQTITGSATDVMREILRRTGIPATISLRPWRLAYKLAQDNPETCVFTTVRTEARESLFKWIGPLATSHWTLYALADNPISARTLNDLKPYAIGGYQSDAKALHMKALGFKIDEANTELQSLKKLQAGRVDLWIASTNSGPWNARALGIRIKPVFTLKEAHGYAACNRAVPSADIARMNAALQAMRADGTYERLMQAYK